MAKLKSFANTTVSLFKTQDDLEKLLIKHKIHTTRWTHYAEAPKVPGTVRFEFEWQRAPERPALGFRVDVSYEYKPGPRGGNSGTTREQAGRALYWHVKNLLDAVEWGIVDLEQAFLPHMLPQGTDGPTMYEQLSPRLEQLGPGEAVGLLSSGR